MKVMCIKNLATDLPKEINPDLVLGKADSSRERRFPLLIGKEYTVFGITIRMNCAWYYVCDEDFTYYPVWSPAALFEITDGRLSRYWRVGYHTWSGTGNQPYFIISFPEWVNDQYFYDKLTDREQKEIDVFEKYRKLIENE